MGLSEVRKEINRIDDSMKLLFDERMDCSNQVAEVKIAEGDSVFKPLREKEICERFADDEEYLTFVKKVMQISRKRHYSIFLDREVKTDTADKLKATKESICETGILQLKVMSDKTATNGLNDKDIISVVADTSLNIKSLNVDDNGQVNISLLVDKNEKAMNEALTLAYMLYEETI